MPFDEENEETLPGVRRPDTLPRIPEWTPPPQPRRRIGKIREKLGITCLVAVIVVILAGIALSSFVPGVRHGIGKVITHHGSPTVKSQLVTPSLRDGSPSLDPSSFTRSPASRPRPSRIAKAAPTRSRVVIIPPPPVRRGTPKPSTRATASATPTVKPTTPSATATVTSPPPTTPAPTTPAPTPTSATPTVTATGAAPATS